VLLAAIVLAALALPGFAAVKPTSRQSKAPAIAHVAAGTATAVLTPLSKTVYVYITKTGKKYHRSGCRYLKKSRKKVKLSWAKSHGYKPCKVCKPPK
jgi:hypothetical protein